MLVMAGQQPVIHLWAILASPLPLPPLFFLQTSTFSIFCYRLAVKNEENKCTFVRRCNENIACIQKLSWLVFSLSYKKDKTWVYHKPLLQGLYMENQPMTVNLPCHTAWSTTVVNNPSVDWDRDSLSLRCTLLCCGQVPVGTWKLLTRV